MGASAKAVDFSSVKDRGAFNPKQVPEGDYAAIITKVEDGESKKDQEFQYIFTIKLKKYSQNAYPYYCKLTENQLWKLRNLLIAAGMNVPKSRIKLDPNKVVGKEIGVTMEDDEFEGKMKSVIGAVFPVAELAEGDGPGSEDDEFDEDEMEDQVDDAEEDDEDEEPEPPKKKKGKKKKAADEDDVDELDITDL